MRDAKVEPAKWLVDDFAGFDPAKPDPIESFTVPDSPSRGGPGGRRGGPPPVNDPARPYGS